MGSKPVWRKIAGAALIALAMMSAACTSSGRGPLPGGRAAGRDGAIIVGSFDFPESVLLADIYAGAIAARGFPVQVMPDLGTRELVDPALMSGLIQIVPEYAGSALEFASLGRLTVTSSVEATSQALAKSVAGRGLVVGLPAAAQDANAVVVTAATAARYRLHSISDLATVARRLVFGGPPECPERVYCLAGLERTYDLHFREFVALDAGGPLTRQALAAGDIDVGLMFSTDPGIPAGHLVILADDRRLQPAENITPMLRRATVVRYGQGLVAALNAVSARLTTGSLRALNAQVELDRRNPRIVADDWLHAQGLLGNGG
jgi:osmoprotectant transport system substrate-binding protein